MSEKHADFTDRHMDSWWTPMPKVWMFLQRSCVPADPNNQHSFKVGIEMWCHLLSIQPNVKYGHNFSCS